MTGIALLAIASIYLQIVVNRDKKRYKAWLKEQRRIERRRRKEEREIMMQERNPSIILLSDFRKAQ
jgi:hypothetical protein